MFNWFSELPAPEQIKLVAELVGFVFMLGVYAATVRFLSKKVGEQGEMLQKHSDTIEDHGEMLARLDERTKAI